MIPMGKPMPRLLVATRIAKQDSYLFLYFVYEFLGQVMMHGVGWAGHQRAA